MHMGDALISPIVGGTMLAASTGVMGYSIHQLKGEVFEKRLPLMGVMGAFLFAAQMINFAIPGTGSSGHIGGGILLAIILGPSAGFLTLASVLLIQALFFADGGLLAFGCNLINLGFFTCFVAYPMIFRPMVRKAVTKRRIIIGAILASIVGLQLGSLGVVAQTWFSGRTELPLSTFLLFMQPIHLAIGIVEGMITGLIVSYLYSQNAAFIYAHQQSDDVKTAMKPKRHLVMKVMVAALVVGGLISLFASSNPDGLEWAVFKTANTEEVANESTVIHWLERAQEQISFMPDYGFGGRMSSDKAETSVSGIVGSFITLGIVLLLGIGIKRRGRRVSQNE
ncbi:PDGLE domain-containing protein [Vallitalea pronyensis]|uniref:PDGLE domain-containing protein n=1 Tax=Vallitalea pronyensis TaxID=1348613 RepID=A0A8J8SGF9_9FIRM|nr:energy-coupling factor ABC transporter permease [Vallitalea pronyensis]QUI22273.1 PDGLE domain-containing protein [Vallitalea pronyensis]